MFFDSKLDLVNKKIYSMKKSFIAVLVLVCSLSSVNVFAQKADQASKNIKFSRLVSDLRYDV